MRIQNITQEDIDIFIRRDEPDYDKKFKAVMLKYLENSQMECADLKDKKVKKEWEEQLDSIEYFLHRDNWLVELPSAQYIYILNKAGI